MAVYFAKMKCSDKVKIGYTRGAVEQRIDNIRTSCPEELEIVHVIPNGTPSTEKNLHRIFETSRIHREWFAYRPEIAVYIGDLDHDEKYYLLDYRLFTYPHLKQGSESTAYMMKDLELSWRRGLKDLDEFIEHVGKYDFFRWGSPLSNKEKSHVLSMKRSQSYAQKNG